MLVARDGESDNVDRGVGTDSFEVDSTDNVASCENGSAGVLRLAPRALAAEAGRTARLRLSWHHPQNWRKLRKIELRLLARDGVPVGEVTIRPRGERISADGAVKLLRKRSRLTRPGSPWVVGGTYRLALRRVDGR